MTDNPILHFYKNRRDREFGVFIRGFVHFASLLLVILTFALAAKANINQGVFGGLLTANIFYSAILFYLKYKEKISTVTAVAMCLIFAVVLCISYKDEEIAAEVNYTYLLLSVLCS